MCRQNTCTTNFQYYIETYFYKITTLHMVTKRLNFIFFICIIIYYFIFIILASCKSLLSNVHYDLLRKLKLQKMTSIKTYKFCTFCKQMKLGKQILKCSPSIYYINYKYNLIQHYTYYIDGCRHAAVEVKCCAPNLPPSAAAACAALLKEL